MACNFIKKETLAQVFFLVNQEKVNGMEIFWKIVNGF